MGINDFLIAVARGFPFRIQENILAFISVFTRGVSCNVKSGQFSWPGK